MMIFNMSTSYFHKKSFHYFDDYLMMNLTLRKNICTFSLFLPNELIICLLYIYLCIYFIIVYFSMVECLFMFFPLFTINHPPIEFKAQSMEIYINIIFLFIFIVLNVIACLMGCTMPIAYQMFESLRSRVLGV